MHIQLRLTTLTVLPEFAYAGKPWGVPVLRDNECIIDIDVRDLPAFQACLTQVESGEPDFVQDVEIIYAHVTVSDVNASIGAEV